MVGKNNAANFKDEEIAINLYLWNNMELNIKNRDS